MPTPTDLFFAVVLPGILSFVVLLVFWIRTGDPSRRILGSGAAIAVVVAFCASFFARLGKIGFEPRDAHHWLLLIASVVLVASMIPIWRNWLLGAVAMFLIASFAIWRIVSFMFRPEGEPRFESTGEGATTIAALAGVFTLLWLMLRPLAQRRVVVTEAVSPGESPKLPPPIIIENVPPTDGYALPIALFLTLMGTGAVVAFQGSQDIGLMTNGLAAAMGSAAIIAFFRRDSFALGPAALATVLALFAALVAAGSYVAELQSGPAALLIFAPILVWMIRLPGIRFLPWWGKVMITVIAVGIPVAIAVVPPYQAFTSQPVEPNYGY